MSTSLDSLIGRAWDVHDAAPDTEANYRLRTAIWSLEDTLDEQTRCEADPQFGQLPDQVRDGVVSVIVARIHVQAGAGMNTTSETTVPYLGVMAARPDAEYDLAQIIPLLVGGVTSK